ncbi:hypothetical protein SPRG_00092 [Saprolegnia parasitica CBS 223.65]|uniref:Uncharacterized protein n=1 Tax=Saprolegnia parasitica (strain CBS 223.65) TaxID=695850 RepID=A0A067D8C5_SAPPC|nr:hypothetical protein SPRG_00092 [Saprolegnia parasitica CBS 223.65]KDO35247.1 hypothetical protein SPRG_00092 [Saprolegnia parasitica CBS 223.65]|eukprot:XP_012193598.1 hypothetical protein SPRG_00092 [Saprolegnia parasitica CBS 223.65]
MSSNAMCSLSTDDVRDIDDLDELRAILKAHRQKSKRLKAQVAVLRAAEIHRAVLLFDDAGRVRGPTQRRRLDRSVAD